MDYREVFKKVLLSRAHCNLGKDGITAEFIAYVVKLLKKYKIIKIKALKSIAMKSDIDSLASDISKLTNSYILDIRGKQIILSKYPISRKELKRSSKNLYNA
ncbi:MAG: YhbY family RNA-binding protein [Candidatus Hodarchaeota archaeon]